MSVWKNQFSPHQLGKSRSLVSYLRPSMDSPEKAKIGIDFIIRVSEWRRWWKRWHVIRIQGISSCQKEPLSLEEVYTLDDKSMCKFHSQEAPHFHRMHGTSHPSENANMNLSAGKTKKTTKNVKKIILKFLMKNEIGNRHWSSRPRHNSIFESITR